MNISDLTAIIPVRLGSERVKLKNIRSFAGSSLLDIKLQQLQSIEGLNVIVTSSDAEIKDIVSKYQGIFFHERDKSLSQSSTPTKELYKYYSSIVKTPFILSTSAMCPLADASTYQSCISKAQKVIPELHDSLVTANVLKQFVFDEKNKPKNFNLESGYPRSQDLPDWKFPNFVCNIVSTDYVKKNHDIFGNNPFWYEISQLEGFDIDTEYDFTTAELLFKQKHHSPVFQFRNVGLCCNYTYSL